MKVTRLRLGYRVHLNDSEMAALQLMTKRPGPVIEEKRALEALTPSAKAAMNRPRFKLPDGPLSQVDDDRRVDALSHTTVQPHVE